MIIFNFVKRDNGSLNYLLNKRNFFSGGLVKCILLDQFNMFKTLLESGADILEVVNGKSNVIQYSISVAKDSNYFKEIMKYNPDLNQIDNKNYGFRNYQRPLLYDAIYYGKKDIFDILLKKGFPLSKPTSAGEIPLHYSISLNKKYFVRKILEDKEGIKTINIRAPYKACETLFPGYTTPLYIATELKNIEIVKLLLDNGAKINKYEYGRDSPAYLCCIYNNKGILKLFMENGIHPNNYMNEIDINYSRLAIDKNYRETVFHLLPFNYNIRNLMIRYTKIILNPVTRFIKGDRLPSFIRKFGLNYWLCANRIDLKTEDEEGPFRLPKELWQVIFSQLCGKDMIIYSK